MLAIGSKIRRVRELRGITQEQLADAVGVQKAAIQKIESGSTASITVGRLNDIAKALGVNPAYIAGWSGEAMPEGIRPGNQTPAEAELGDAVAKFLEVLDDPAINVLGRKIPAAELALLRAAVEGMAGHIEREAQQDGGDKPWKE